MFKLININSKSIVMKKYFVVFLFALFATLSYAQRPQGHVSIIPRVGLDIANLSGNKIYYTSSTMKSMKSKYNARFVGGVDVEYQLLPMSSISLGAFYSQQGCRFPDYSSQVEIESVSGSKETENWEKQRWKLDYVQVPLMFNQYVSEGLAVKVGVQMGFLMNAKVSYTINLVDFDKDGKVVSEKNTSTNTDIKKTLRTMDFTIPIGVSYEYQNVILDLRYNFGIKSIYKDKEMPKEKNSFLLFTMGYRIF